MLSRHRHHRLVRCLEQAGEPAGQRGAFALYWLTASGEATADRAAELVIVHDLEPSAIDNNAGRHVLADLLPLLDDARRRWLSVSIADVWAGSSHQVYTALVGQLVYSLHADPETAWSWFYANTLSRLTDAMSAADEDVDPDDFIEPFGRIYRRVGGLCVGSTLLDVGTAHGFLPMLLAARPGSPDRDVLGVDLSPMLIRLANRYAAATHLPARFATFDLFGPEAEALPRFDTVTALHLLEHLPPERTGAALRALWDRTGRRLIVNVPIEATPEAAFGHEQVFDTARLDELASELDGECRTFAYHGAWLVADR